MTYKVMTCCRGHPELPHHWPQWIAACDWRNATAVLRRTAVRHPLVTLYINIEVSGAPGCCSSTFELPLSLFNTTKLALNSQSIKDYCGSAAEYTILSLYPQRTLDDNVAMTHNEIRGEIRQGLHHVVKGLGWLKLSEFYSKCKRRQKCPLMRSKLNSTDF